MISLDNLRRRAKALKKAHAAGEADALARVRAVLPEAAELKHADALHVVAREEGFDSWPRLKFAVDAAAMDRAARAERLKIALYHGQHWVVDQLLGDDPALGRAHPGLVCALYDADELHRLLAADEGLATRLDGVRRPMTHLAFSQHFKARPELAPQMLEVAELLLAHGADVNDSYPYDGDENAPLSALYGAIGHAGNMALGEWLLTHGADPNDGESLYHATELGHTRGLELLLTHGADPQGTNALPRALDFNDHAMVRLLLDAGADPNEGIAEHVSGEPPWVIPTLHQAARRMCDGAMIGLLLDAGADPSARYKGMTPYAIARVYGNAEAARLIAGAGGETGLTDDEQLLAAAADGPVAAGRYIDPAKLTDEYRDLIRAVLALPDRMTHVRRLVGIGLEYDRPDPMGLTPVQIAGWEGLPDQMGYFLSLGPDLSHVNGYGGTLLSTIVHGSENCPARQTRDHIACARLALDHGVALPQPVIELAGAPDMAAFLAEWGTRHPGQVVAHGPG